MMLFHASAPFFAGKSVAQPLRIIHTSAPKGLSRLRSRVSRANEHDHPNKQ